jgi:hypothetical protein
MKLTKRGFFRISIVALAFSMAIGLGVLTSGEPASKIVTGTPALETHHVGLVDDWSFHHLVFSNPGTYEQVKNNPAAYSRWLTIQYDTRYIMQQAKRAGGASASGSFGSTPEAITLRPDIFGLASPIRPIGGRPPGRGALSKDWSEALLTGALLPNTFPAKYTFNPIGTPSCSGDYVVFPTGSAGASSAATIIAYNNLYVGTGACESTNPTVYWAYNTGAYKVTTSPVLSSDGSKVAFIQATSSAMELVVLKWASSTTETVSSPGTPTTSTNITTCSAPCMTVTTITSSYGDGYSSPFYDYTSGQDAIYVGDNASHLYKITGVFNGTTSPTITSVTLNSTAYNVAPPVYDLTSGCVFVGDSEGYLYSVDSGASTTAGVCKSGTYKLFGHSENLGDGSANEGIFDAPLVDPTAQRVYAFVTASAAITATGSCTANQNCVDQFTTSTITSGSTTAAPAEVESLGTGGANYNLYAGTFDNVYYTSSTPSTPSGNIYIVGATGSTSGTLYQVGISSNTMSTPSSKATVNGLHYPWPTPVTEFYNANLSPATDFIFFSVYRGNVGNCSDSTSSGGCLLGYNVTTPSSVSLSSSAAVTFPGGSGENGCWGTSAFIIDNSSTSTGASQVYFINFDGNYPSAGTSNCATSGSSTGNTIDATQDQQSSI